MKFKKHFKAPLCQGEVAPPLRGRRGFVFFLPAFLWMVFIFYLSSLPTTGIPGTQTERFIILKSFHLIEYGILAISLYIGFKKFRHTIFTAYLYALSDELHQSFIPGREARFRDTLIDLLGIFIGIILIKTLIRFKILKNSY